MELDWQEKIHAECLRRAKRILDPIALSRKAESPKRLAERLARAHKAIVEVIEESDTYGDADHILWSAISAVLFDDHADNVHPYSVGGQRLMSLCNAKLSASAMFKAADQRIDQIKAMKSMEWSRLCIEKHRASIEKCRTEMGRSKGSKRCKIEKAIAFLEDHVASIQRSVERERVKIIDPSLVLTNRQIAKIARTFRNC